MNIKQARLGTFKHYFRLRYGLANAINDYKRLKIRVVCVGNFFTFIDLFKMFVLKLSGI